MRDGAFRLFRFLGIDVRLHWTWFLIAAWEVSARKSSYTSPVWNALEYVSLFAIVTLHEFGHALACRSVGGRAERIVLWPLGGVAYVEPPQRPGAVLWSIAAGPLVNLALIPVTVAATLYGRSIGLGATSPDVYGWLTAITYINIGLFVFNVLPVYPLDGGQILRALLWFFIGRAHSLMVAALFGFLGVAALVGLAVVTRSVWTGIIAFWVGSQCLGGFRYARALYRLAQVPRRTGFACPSCGQPPPIGLFWGCDLCHHALDMFETGPVCPSCAARFQLTTCLDCGASHPFAAWKLP